MMILFQLQLLYFMYKSECYAIPIKNYPEELAATATSTTTAATTKKNCSYTQIRRILGTYFRVASFANAKN